MSKFKSRSTKLKKLVGSAVLIVGGLVAVAYVARKVTKNDEEQMPVTKTKTDPSSKS